MKLRIYGASDDLLEIGGDVQEEFNDTLGQFRLLLSKGDEALVVVADYLPGAVWGVGVAQVDEDTPLPAWPVTVVPGAADECSYSPTLVIDAPNGVVIAQHYPA